MRQIYAIRDRIADDIVGLQMYALFTFKTDEQAARYFADTLFDEKSILNKHPNDYALLMCGLLDDSGVIDPMIPPRIVTTGSALVAITTPKLADNA